MSGKVIDLATRRKAEPQRLQGRCRIEGVVRQVPNGYYIEKNSEGGWSPHAPDGTLIVMMSVSGWATPLPALRVIEAHADSHGSAS